MLLVALVLVAAIRTGLKLLPFRWCLRLLERHGRPYGRPDGHPATGPDEARLQRIVWACSAVSRRLLRDRPCLTQALAVRLLLGRRGTEATLRIGVAKNAGHLRAHAWLEHAGRVLIGGTASPCLYAPLAGALDGTLDGALPRP